MAQFIGESGKYLKKQQFHYYGIAGILFLVLILFIYFLPKLITLVSSIVGLVIFVVLMKVVFEFFPDLIAKFKNKGNNYLHGQQGEDEVADELNKLTDDYFILRNIKFENSPDNDITIVGPTGIFALEVKDYGPAVVDFNNDKLTFSGREDSKNILNQAFTEAMNLQKYLFKNNLQTFVNPVVVFSRRMKLNFGFNKIKNVFVIGKPFLNKLITSQQIIFSDAQIKEIVIVLKNLQNTQV